MSSQHRERQERERLAHDTARDAEMVANQAAYDLRNKARNIVGGLEQSLEHGAREARTALERVASDLPKGTPIFQGVMLLQGLVILALGLAGFFPNLISWATAKSATWGAVSLPGFVFKSHTSLTLLRVLSCLLLSDAFSNFRAAFTRDRYMGMELMLRQVLIATTLLVTGFIYKDAVLQGYATALMLGSLPLTYALFPEVVQSWNKLTRRMSSLF